MVDDGNWIHTEVMVSLVRARISSSTSTQSSSRTRAEVRVWMFLDNEFDNERSE